MTYEEAIQKAINHFGDAMVITGGYDQEINDHLNDLENDQRQVSIDEDATVFGRQLDAAGWIIHWVDDDDYIVFGEPAARIVSIDAYEVLER